MEQEKKKSNKKIFIIVAVVVIVLVIAFIIRNIQNKDNNNNGSLIFGSNEDNLMSKKEHIYGNSQVNKMNQGILVEDENNIYYSVKESDYKNSLYKKSKSTNESIKLMTTNAKFLNIYEDTLYYINEDEHSIFKMQTDGGNRTRVADDVDSMFMVDNYIYCTKGVGLSDGLFRIDTTNNKQKCITSESVKEFNIYNNYIYYNNSNDGQLYRIDLNGKNKKTIFTDKVEHICIVNDMIYVSDLTDGRSIYQLNLDGSENKKILEIKSNASNSFIIMNEHIGIIHSIGLDKYLCFYDIQGNLIKKISVGEQYKNLGIYQPNYTTLGIYGDNILIDTNYGRYTFLENK